MKEWHYKIFSERGTRGDLGLNTKTLDEGAVLARQLLCSRAPPHLSNRSEAGGVENLGDAVIVFTPVVQG